MPYVLGIDVGSTRTTAAVCRRGGANWGEPEVVSLEGGARWVDSVLQVSDDRAIGGFVRRVGDEVPLLLDGQLYAAEALLAALAGWVADLVAELENGPAERIVVTHPPGWGAHRRGVLQQALFDAGLPGVLLLPTPVAAAESHLAREGTEVGAALAICRLGGQHLETALLRRGPVGFELLGYAESAEPMAGAHLDDLLVGHVLGQLDLDRSDTAVARAMAGLRVACAEAKERLSLATDVTIPVALPGTASAGVHVTRTEFERLARPVLAAAVAQLSHTASAVAPEQLAAAVLVGGSARIPLATDLAAAALNCRVIVDPDPGTAICRGAALAGRPRLAAEPDPTESTSLVTRHGLDDLAEFDDLDHGAPPPPRPPVEITPLEAPKRFALAWRSRT